MRYGNINITTLFQRSFKQAKKGMEKYETEESLTSTFR